MRTLEDLTDALDRYADRGTPRGAAAVFGAAADQTAMDETASGDGRAHLEREPGIGRTRQLQVALLLFVVAGTSLFVLVASSGRPTLERTSAGSADTTVGSSRSLPVTVRPDRDLHDGDVLTVALPAVAPSARLSVEVCRDDEATETVPAADQCDARPAEGFNPATVRVPRQLVLADGHTVDCAAVEVSCVLVVAEEKAPRDSAGAAVPLHFAPTDAPLPEVSADQTRELRDSQAVVVTGRHFPAGAHLEVDQLAHGSRSASGPVEVVVDGAGNFEATVVVHATLPPDDAPCEHDCGLSVMPQQASAALPVLFIPIEVIRP